MGPFLQDYIGSRTDVKPSTATVFGHTQRCLVSYFGEHRALREITPGDADARRRHLARPKATTKSSQPAGEGLAENTVRRRCAIARQFFRAAQRQRLITENPFGDTKGIGVRENRSRDFFVTREATERLLAVCPDSQWRTIVALARYGGLRVPSELLELRWSDIDWSRGRVLVRSPKTAHHAGGEYREMPLFPQLRRHLDEAFQLAEEEGSEFVITRYREATQNLRTTLEKLVRRAGLQSWPKLFQNLRSSRATELAEEYPGHVAAAWLGHSEAIANKHYRQTTDEHFARALRALHPALQQGAQPSETEVTGPDVSPVNSREMHSIAPLAATGMGGTGLEPPPESSGNTPISTENSANCSAPCAQSRAVDPRLAAIVEAWPTLPESVKAKLGVLVAEAEQR